MRLHSRASITKDRAGLVLPQSANVRIVYGGNKSGPVGETMQKMTGELGSHEASTEPTRSWLGR